MGGNPKSRVKEYLNLGILQMSRYGLNLKLEYISIELISTYHISPLPGC